MEPMTQKERRALVCRLVKAMRDAGSWTGETHIQKCLYFLQNLMKVPAGYDFILYKHGPYSFDLQREMAVMGARFQLDVEPRYPYGPSVILGPRGELDLGLVSQYAAAVEFVARELSTEVVRSLERLYLQRSSYRLSTQAWKTARSPGESTRSSLTSPSPTPARPSMK